MTLGARSTWGTRISLVVGGIILLILLFAVFVVNWNNSLAQTEGHFNYGLDDPYIHLAISKNIAQHGIWGVTQYAYSSASSSPLWTAILAVSIKLVGDHDLIPFVLGVIASCAVAFVCFFRFKSTGFHTGLAVACSFAVFMVGPLQLLPFTGMEHSLQILLDLIFSFWLLDVFSAPITQKQIRFAVLITALMCLCR